MRFLVILITALVLLLGGCAQAAQKAVEQTTGISVDQKGGSVTVKGQDEESITFSGTIPDELKSFPVPDGFKFDAASAASMTSGKDNLSVGTWKGKAKVTDITPFYKKTATEKAWTLGWTFEDADGGQVHATAKDGMGYVVTYNTDDDGQVEISVMASKGGPQTATPTVKVAAEATRSVQPTATPQKPKATPTPSTPALADASVVPAELKDAPLPSGFGVVKGSEFRMASGDQVAASVQYFGKGDLTKVQEFYRKGYTDKGFVAEASMASSDEATLIFNQEKDGKTTMVVVLIENTDAGVEITISVQIN